MHFTSVDHVGFTVSNLDRSIKFYSLLLGAEPVLRKTWDVDYVGKVLGYESVNLDVAFWQLPEGLALELIQYIAPESTVVDMETHNVGNAHLCLVTDDIDAAFERLLGEASLRSSEPVVIPWGPYEGGSVAYIRDPDGISIELLSPPPGGRDFGYGVA